MYWITIMVGSFFVVHDRFCAAAAEAFKDSLYGSGSANNLQSPGHVKETESLASQTDSDASDT